VSQAATTHIVYAAAAPPEQPQPGTIAGVCRACGISGVGVDFLAWVRPTFTDWGLLQVGSIVCAACQFCFAEQSEVLAAQLGKREPQRFRNYSHFVVGGAWRALSKGNKKEMIEILGQSPQVAVIADSGQKHIVFRAKPGWWQFEELAIRPEVETLMFLIGEMVPALATFSKQELLLGRYSFSRIAKYGLPESAKLAEKLKPHRGSAVFALALFLAQREEEEKEFPNE
jgi:hypothetical protein